MFTLNLLLKMTIRTEQKLALKCILFTQNVYSDFTLEKHENLVPTSLKRHQRRHFKLSTLFSVWLRSSCGSEWNRTARVRNYLNIII